MAHDWFQDHEVQEVEGEADLRMSVVVLRLASAAMAIRCSESHWHAAWAIGKKVALQSSASENDCSPHWPDVMHHPHTGVNLK